MKLIYKVFALLLLNTPDKVREIAAAMKKDARISEPCRVVVRKVRKVRGAEPEGIVCLLPVSLLPTDKDAADTLLAKYVVDCQGHYRRQFSDKGTAKDNDTIV